MTVTRNQVLRQGMLSYYCRFPHTHSACDRSAMMVAQFDPTGRHIFVGTSTGSILVFNTRTKTVSCAFILALWMI
jgi:hypothetical protein